MTMPGRRPNGFTFIELVIAVTIFSIVATAVYSIFMGGVQLWRRGNAVIEVNQPMRIFFDMGSADLSNTIAFAYTTGGMNFIGEPRKMSFVTVATVVPPDAAPRAEIARVVYEFQEEKKSVTRTVATRDEGFNEGLVPPVTVLDRVAADTEHGFRYCYKPEAEGGAYIWKETWNKPDKVPRGVRIIANGFAKTVIIPTGTLGGE